MPFQFIVKHSTGRTLGMADYLSRHPSPSNKYNQIKAEELWNHWFPINKIDQEKTVLDIQNRKGTTSEQPIRRGIATENQTPKGKRKTNQT